MELNDKVNKNSEKHDLKIRSVIARFLCPRRSIFFIRIEN